MSHTDPPTTERIPARRERLTYDSAIVELCSDVPDERFDAALALAHFGNSSAIGPLREARIREDDGAVRAVLGSAIATLCGEYPDAESAWYPNDPHPGDQFR